jgi:Xaa-Pro aminopeptidase
VLEAQLAAISVVSPGAKISEVDKAARSVLKRSKLEKFFTHSTGHGVGLEIHEPPRVAATQDGELKPGMVITIEPGIYVPGKGGIRIEDMVLVTSRGYELLTSARKDFVEL